MIKPVPLGCDRREGLHHDSTVTALDLPLAGGRANTLRLEKLTPRYALQTRLDSEKCSRAMHERNDVGMLRVERHQTQRRIERKLHSIAILPVAIDLGPRAGLQSSSRRLSVYQQGRLLTCPRRHAQANREMLRPV